MARAGCQTWGRLGGLSRRPCLLWGPQDGGASRELTLQTEILQIPARQEGSSFPSLADVNPCFWAPKTRKFLFGRENLTAYIQTAQNERFFVKTAAL